MVRWRTLRRGLLGLSLLAAVLGRAAVAAEPYAPPSGWGLAWAPLRSIEHRLEFRGEWRQERYGVALLASAGGQTAQLPMEQVQRGVGTGTQAFFAAMGDMRRGLLVGAELRYDYDWVTANSDLVPIPASTHQLAAGALLAARWASAKGGLFGELQVSAQWHRAVAEVTCCASVRQQQTTSGIRVVPAFFAGFLW